MDKGTTGEPTLQRLAGVIRAELVLGPGRLSLIARIVLACTTVMIVVMVFRIPGAALGAYYPLLLSRDSPRATARSAARTAFICTAGTAAVILGAMMFAGSPFMHFFWVAGNLFAVFYLISSLVAYDAALALGLIVTNAITTWDQPLSSDMRVTQTLFTLLSILIACAVSVGIEYLLAQTHAPDAILASIRQRLTQVGGLLQAYAKGESDVLPLSTSLSRLATKGTGHLRERLAHSGYEISYKERLAAAIALSGRLVELAANVAELAPQMSARDRARCAVSAANIAAIETRLLQEEAPDWLDLPEESEASVPLLVEIERNINLIAQNFTDQDQPAHHHLPEPGERPRPGVFAKDAFTNQEHLRFAIRGTLSALACYLVYMSVGWTGLSASIATCILTALTNTGASRHKQLLRFAGIVFGACVLGFGTQALILPQIDSLFAFALLFAFVIAIGAWVGTSGPRIAYAGAQIVLAYDLVNLNRFAINTSLVPARDTVLGIMVGIFSMWLIFDHLWASPSTQFTRAIFLSTLREIAELDRPTGPVSPIGEARRLMAECERINSNFDRLRNLVDFSVFESFPKTREEVYITQCVKTLQPQLRAFLLLRTGLLQHRFSTGSGESSEIVRQVQQRSSEILLKTVQMIEDGCPEQVLQSGPQPISITSVMSSIREMMRKAQMQQRSDIVTEMRLCASLLDLAHHLHSSVRCME